MRGVSIRGVGIGRGAGGGAADGAGVGRGAAAAGVGGGLCGIRGGGFTGAIGAGRVPRSTSTDSVRRPPKTLTGRWGEPSCGGRSIGFMDVSGSVIDAPGRVRGLVMFPPGLVIAPPGLVMVPLPLVMTPPGVVTAPPVAAPGFTVRGPGFPVRPLPKTVLGSRRPGCPMVPGRGSLRSPMRPGRGSFRSPNLRSCHPLPG